MSGRMADRLIRAMTQEIDRLEAYRNGLDREDFARDGLRRDASERCMTRIAAIGARLGEIDAGALDRLRETLSRLPDPRGAAPLSRMDSDVLWSLADGCIGDLRHRLGRPRRAEASWRS